MIKINKSLTTSDKPVGFEELGARIKALLRRAHGLNDENSLTISNIKIYPNKFLVEAKNQEIEIGVIEFKMLYFLMKNKNRYFDRQSLIDNVWGQLAEVDERTVDVNILRIRKALEKQKLGGLIRTKRGIGYSFSTNES